MTNNELSPEAGLSNAPKGSWTWGIIAATGLALAIGAVGNLAMGWVPPRVQNDYWRFMVSGSTLDGFPVLALGAIAVFAGLYALRNSALLRIYVWLSAALTLALCGIYAAFVTTLPRIHQMAESATDADVVRENVIRTTVSFAVMALLLAGVTWAAWKLSRRRAPSK
jgi:hypothetical protein